MTARTTLKYERSGEADSSPTLQEVGHVCACEFGELSILATADAVEVVGEVEVVKQGITVNNQLDYTLLASFDFLSGLATRGIKFQVRNCCKIPQKLPK